MRQIYLAATGMNRGKTTVSLGLCKVKQTMTRTTHEGKGKS